MRKPKWDNEKELAKAFVDYFRNREWTVYPELCDLDIVATKPDPTSPKGLKIVGIECKLHFNLTVLAQCYKKKSYVDEIYVGVSKGWKNHEHFGCQIARKFGFGAYFIQKYKGPVGWDYPITKEVQAISEARRTFAVDDLLDPKAENFAEAGQAGGRHWSHFKRTSGLMVEFVTANEGKTLNEVIAAVDHHYSSKQSARSALRKLLIDGVIKELEYKDDKLYLKTVDDGLLPS